MFKLLIMVFLIFLTQSFYAKEIKGEENFIVKENQKALDIQKEQNKIIKQLLNKPTSLMISNKLIKKYYKNHKYKTFFVTSFSIKPLAYDLIKKIKNDTILKHHLNNLLNLNDILLLIEEVEHHPSVENLVKLDFNLVSTYHKYMLLVSSGSIDWKKFNEELEIIKEKENINYQWEKYSAKKNIRRLLYRAVKENDINLAINEINYTFPKAEQLAKKIDEYETLLNDESLIKIPIPKKALKKGNYYPEIKLLKQRLLQDNYSISLECTKKSIEEAKYTDLEDIEVVNIDKSTSSINFDNNNCEELYDEELYLSIKEFQKDNGLLQDGIIGINTIKALNTSLETKVKKMRLNLERMRWLPRNLGEKYIIVNIADYSMKMYSNGEKILEMEAVVGAAKHPTPIFSHRMSEIILNPYWRIPQSIVQKEIIPNLVKNPNYLEEEQIKVHENWDHESLEYETKDIDWSIFLDNEIMADDEFAPMRFIQIPGDKNPLGRMKFLFPNQYSVYLHDTPFKYLFNENNRAFSHGCIRLSEPKKLLETIAKDEKELDMNESDKILKSEERVDIELKKKIPVHIVYLTSWIDENNKIQFRNDIYKFDEIQENILFEKN